MKGQGATERFLADYACDPAASLRDSAARFRAIGQGFSAEFSEKMASDAEAMPASYRGMYRHWARQQAERADRLATTKDAR